MDKKILDDRQVCLKCLDENEVLYDDDERYLKKLYEVKTSLKVESVKEVYHNVQKSREIILMNLKQRIILTEKTVRFNKNNDVPGLESKIQGSGLTTGSLQALKETCEAGYQCLKQCRLLESLVEFDSERSRDLVVFRTPVEMVAKFDMVVLVDENNSGKTGHSKKNTHINVSKDIRNGKKPKQKCDMKNSNDQDSVEEKVASKRRNYSKKVKGQNMESATENAIADDLTMSEPTFSSYSLGRATITAVFAPRGKIPAVDIYRQLLFVYTHNLAKFYLLVFHIGPLVETEKVVLYEYQAPKDLIRWVKCFKKKQTETRISSNHDKKENKSAVKETTLDLKPFHVCLTVKKTTTLGPEAPKDIAFPATIMDVNEMESKFREIKGRRLQQMTELSDYFRYLFTDLPGLKNHMEDKKARYERYVMKKERKREKKRESKTETQKENIIFPDLEHDVKTECSYNTMRGDYGGSTYRSLGQNTARSLAARRVKTTAEHTDGILFNAHVSQDGDTEGMDTHKKETGEVEEKDTIGNNLSVIEDQTEISEMLEFDGSVLDSGDLFKGSWRSVASSGYLEDEDNQDKTQASRSDHKLKDGKLWLLKYSIQKSLPSK